MGAANLVTTTVLLLCMVIVVLVGATELKFKGPPGLKRTCKRFCGAGKCFKIDHNAFINEKMDMSKYWHGCLTRGWYSQKSTPP